MPVQVKQGGVWKSASDLFVKQGGVWKSVSQAYVKQGGVWKELLAAGVLVDANTDQLDLYTLFGSPASAGDFTVIIDTGVHVYSSDPTIPAITTGALPAGSTVTIINNGYIYGDGGNGGHGGSSAGSPQPPGSPGANGGNAISVTVAVTIDNTNGNIYGGGGGGGGGGANYTAGGGGGGGRGYESIGGLDHYYYNPNFDRRGNSGSFTGLGTGGLGRNYYGYVSGNGGDGGDWGENGSNGVTYSGSTSYPTGPGVGGAAGKAINLNGNSITWLGGNNAAQVKGAVS